MADTEPDSKKTPLTGQCEGSLRELAKISFPLTLSALSPQSMLFVDRLFLAHHSTAAVHASVKAESLWYVFACFWVICASISEVFVAQYNGAGNKKRLGEPVWQMIWLSLATSLFFIPMAIWGSPLLYGNEPAHAMERSYFYWMMLFAPTSAMYGALCGFFVGRGSTRLITYLAIGANFLNAILDVALIFGIPGWLPSLGAEGAAIATCGCTVIQVAVLGAIFLNRRNRKECGTGDISFRWEAFWRYFCVGVPGGIYTVVEILGWAALYWMLSRVGEHYLTAVVICQTVIAFFYFIAEGVCKGAAAVAGNMIGSKRPEMVSKVVRAGSRLHLIVFVVLLICYGLFADLLIEQFVPKSDVTSSLVDIRESLKTCLFFCLIYVFFEGLRYLLYGVLQAAGDTFFLMVSGAVSVWLFLILPMYLLIVCGNATVETVMFICAFYVIATCLIHLWRFLAGNWRASALMVPN